jgi:hypothetical protein
MSKERLELFEKMADKVLSDFVCSEDISCGGKRTKALRYLLRQLARFYRVSYAHAKIEERIDNLAPPIHIA